MSPLDRLVFLGLICMADDAGRLVDNVKSIDGLLFACTDDTARDSLVALAGCGRIRRGSTVSGQLVIQITNWDRHQKVDRPNAKACLPDIVDSQGLPKSEKENFTNFATNSRLDLRPTTYDLRPTTYDLRPTTGPDGPDNDPEFAPIWKAYPKRPGNSRQAAWAAFCKSVKKGADPKAMLAGVEAYANYVAEVGTQPEFIKLASTFLGPGKHWEADYPVQPDEGLPKWDDEEIDRLANERESR